MGGDIKHICYMLEKTLGAIEHNYCYVIENKQMAMSIMALLQAQGDTVSLYMQGTMCVHYTKIIRKESRVTIQLHNMTPSRLVISTKPLSSFFSVCLLASSSQNPPSQIGLRPGLAGCRHLHGPPCLRESPHGHGQGGPGPRS